MRPRAFLSRLLFDAYARALQGHMLLLFRLSRHLHMIRFFSLFFMPLTTPLRVMPYSCAASAGIRAALFRAVADAHVYARVQR